MKKSLARKTVILVVIPAITQIILLFGLASLYSEYELYPKRAAQDAEVALCHSAFTVADANLIHYLNLTMTTSLPFDSNQAARYLALVRTTGNSLDTCWRTLSERRKPLLHPVTLLTGYNDTFAGLKRAADIVKIYLQWAEQAVIDMQAAASLAKSLSDTPGQAQSIYQKLSQNGKTKELAAVTRSLHMATIHLQAMTEHQDGKTKNSFESSRMRTDYLVNMQIVGILNLLNMLISGLLFNNNLANRLKIILQNNIRFGRGQKLLAPVSGADEIKELDQAFHEMVRTVSENKAIQRVIIDNALDLICTLDEQGRIISVNSAVQEILAYKAHQIIDTWLMDYIDIDDQGLFSTALAQSRQGQKPQPFEIKALRRDKSKIELLCSLVSEPGQSAIFCIFQNISRSKSAARLQQQVTALVCEDLQKPINEMIILHQALKDGQLGPVLKDGARQLEIAQSCTLRMQTLVKDLSDSQKADQGNLSINKAVLPVARVFGHAIDATSALAQAQRIELKSQDHNLQVFGDGDRLVQVLINLIANAIKFSPPDTTITLAVRQSPLVTELAVCDQGRGIPAHLIATVFDRFSQAQFADAKVKGGSGLGLAICKSLVELHGGTITVTSVVDKGTTFVISLPNPAQNEATRGG